MNRCRKDHSIYVLKSMMTLARTIDRFEVVEESLDVFVARGEKPLEDEFIRPLRISLGRETDHFLSLLSENMVSGGRIAFWNHLNDRSPGSSQS